MEAISVVIFLGGLWLMIGEKSPFKPLAEENPWFYAVFFIILCSVLILILR